MCMLGFSKKPKAVLHPNPIRDAVGAGCLAPLETLKIHIVMNNLSDDCAAANHLRNSQIYSLFKIIAIFFLVCRSFENSSLQVFMKSIWCES